MSSKSSNFSLGEFKAPLSVGDKPEIPKNHMDIQISKEVMEAFAELCDDAPSLEQASEKTKKSKFVEDIPLKKIFGEKKKTKAKRVLITGEVARTERESKLSASQGGTGGLISNMGSRLPSKFPSLKNSPTKENFECDVPNNWKSLSEDGDTVEIKTPKKTPEEKLEIVLKELGEFIAPVEKEASLGKRAPLGTLGQSETEIGGQAPDYQDESLHLEQSKSEGFDAKEPNEPTREEPSLNMVKQKQKKPHLEFVIAKKPVQTQLSFVKPRKEMPPIDPWFTENAQFNVHPKKVEKMCSDDEKELEEFEREQVAKFTSEIFDDWHQAIYDSKRILSRQTQLSFLREARTDQPGCVLDIKTKRPDMSLMENDPAVRGMMNSNRNELHIAGSTAPQSGKNNAKGLHLIIGVAELHSFVKNETSFRGAAFSEILDWEGASTTEWKRWDYIKAIPDFINYLSSDAFMEKQNSKIQKRVDQLPSNRQDAVSRAVKGRRVYPLFGSKDYQYVWSIEGYKRWRQNPDNLRLLHVHILIFKRAMTETINPEKIQYDSELLRNAFGSVLTIRTVYSRNQLAYLAKEKFCFGTTVIVSPEWNPIPSVILPENCPQYANHLVMGEHNNCLWENVFGYVDGIISDGTFKGKDCDICIQSSDQDKEKFCSKYGWNHSIAEYLYKKNDTEFMTHFGGVAAKQDKGGAWGVYQNMIRKIDADKESALARFRTMLSFKGELLRNYFISRGVPEESLFQLMSMLQQVCTAWTLPGGPEKHHTRFLARAQEWIGHNLKPEICHRNLLCVGGVGGLGKTTIIGEMLRGAGFTGHASVMKPGETGRLEIVASDLARFYDDVHKSLATAKSKLDPRVAATRSVFYCFTEFESPRSMLYQSSVQLPALEFIVASSADFKALPSFETFQVVHGTNATHNEYLLEVSQWKRRFTLFQFRSADEFLVPYRRFLQGSDYYAVETKVPDADEPAGFRYQFNDHVGGVPGWRL